MENIFCKLELVFIVVAATICSLNTFITGYELIKTVEKLNMAIGIVEIILSISVAALIFAYCQFYKLLD